MHWDAINNRYWTAEARDALRADLATIPDAWLREILDAALDCTDSREIPPAMRGVLNGLLQRVVDERRRSDGRTAS